MWCRLVLHAFIAEVAPARTQAGELMGVLLGGLARLGMNALLVRRMVAAMATRAGGRAALCMGVTLWQRKAGSATAGEADAKAALQWAVAHLWQIGTPPSGGLGVWCMKFRRSSPCQRQCCSLP